MHQSLTPNAAALAEEALAWMDALWNDEAGLIQHRGEGLAPDSKLEGRTHIVRESVWYALGLLLRDGSGDSERAIRAIGAVLDQQYDRPDQPYHGTFRRAPEEADPPAAPVEWRDYDPNWREFIGTTLALILIEFEGRLPAELIARIDRALHLAVAGTLMRQVPATYTNIALMTAYLLDYCADRFDRPDWRAAGADLAEAIYALFDRTGGFEEYNSPTYYGIDIYALALWRGFSGSERLRELGADMEARLWRDIASYYHAGMRNIAGPYDRAYGIDMRRYISVLGLWIRLAVGERAAPLPDLTRPFDHPYDLCFAPCAAFTGVCIPDDAMPHFVDFQGERIIEHVINPDRPARVATAWLSDELILGAEASEKPAWYQFYPITIHWGSDEGGVGWVRLRHTVPLTARAGAHYLHIICPGDGSTERSFRFEVGGVAIDPAQITAERWALPGLIVAVTTNARGVTVTQEGDYYVIAYGAGRVASDQPISFEMSIVPV